MFKFPFKVCINALQHYGTHIYTVCIEVCLALVSLLGNFDLLTWM